MNKLNFFLFCYYLLVNQILSGGAIILSNNNNDIWKRDTGLPFEALPTSNNCTVPGICNVINNSQIQCRCNDILTLCKNDHHQYCWGSKTLTKNSNCPSIPNPCQADFNSTVSCLCNDKNVLCVDEYNHYCYGAIILSSNSTPSVSLQPLIPSSLSSLSPSKTNPYILSSSLAASQTIAATETPNPSMNMAVSFNLSSSSVSYLYCIVVFILIHIL